MSTYTVEQLCQEGPKYALALLLRAIKQGEPFVTYGDIRSELEHQLGIATIFPTQIGHVAGTLMNEILEIDPRAPLINVLVTRANGVPGSGAASYLANRYSKDALRDWDNIPKKKKLKIVANEREKVFQYKKWKELSKRLYGADAEMRLRVLAGNEHDYASINNFGSTAESEQHKKLKEWVARNPKAIGVPAKFGKGYTEARLLSGDEVDVMFSSGGSFRTVEVKSIISNDEDFRRGIYQCVKYREVKRAEHLPFPVDVDAILVTERPLNPDLQERARTVGVKFKHVKVNKGAT